MPVTTANLPYFSALTMGALFIVVFMVLTWNSQLEDQVFALRSRYSPPEVSNIEFPPEVSVLHSIEAIPSGFTHLQVCILAPTAKDTGLDDFVIKSTTGRILYRIVP